jgi:hypothetical protein
MPSETVGIMEATMVKPVQGAVLCFRKSEIDSLFESIRVFGKMLHAYLERSPRDFVMGRRDADCWFLEG